MKSLLIGFAATLMSCAGTPSQTSSGMQKNTDLLVSESQGGTDQAGFRVIKDEKDFQNTIKGSSRVVDLGTEPAVNYPKFPKNKKVVLYNLGTFRSGSHSITKINGVSVKNNVLYVEVPAGYHLNFHSA